MYKYRLQEILDGLPKDKYRAALTEISNLLEISTVQLYNIRNYQMGSKSSASTDQMQTIATYFHQTGIYPNCTVNDLLNHQTQAA